MTPNAAHDVVVVGGGPGGSTVANHLARAGLSVALFEREAFPRFKVGESLVPATMLLLKRLGALEPIGDGLDQVRQHRGEALAPLGRCFRFHAPEQLVHGAHARMPALRALAAGGAEPAYVGMIGSRRRVRAAFEQLAAEGVPADWLARIHAPLGLDIGAESPAEIAIAVGAELVLTARGGSGRPLSERAEVVRRLRSLATATPDEAR